MALGTSRRSFLASSASSQTQLMLDLRPGYCFPLADLFEGVAPFPRLGGCQGVVGVVDERWLRQDGDHATGDLEFNLVARFEARPAPYLIWHGERSLVSDGDSHGIWHLWIRLRFQCRRLWGVGQMPARGSAPSVPFGAS